MICINCKLPLAVAFAFGTLLALVTQVLSFELGVWSPSSFVAECRGAVPSDLLCDPTHIVLEANVTTQLAEVNNNTEGVINCEVEKLQKKYYGYIIAAAVIDSVEPGNETNTPKIVNEFGSEVQKMWFGGMICDNSTLILVSLNTSSIYLFLGEGTALRMRTHHREVCAELRVERHNATEALMTCIDAVDAALRDALKPWSNAVWGYTGIVVIMTMLIFHYWIK